MLVKLVCNCAFLYLSRMYMSNHKCVHKNRTSFKASPLCACRKLVQQGEDGHSPIEDSATCMELVLHKLSKGKTLHFNKVVSIASLRKRNMFTSSCAFICSKVLYIRYTCTIYMYTYMVSFYCLKLILCTCTYST